MIHNFETSLRQSAEQSDEPWWDDVYRAAFPTLQSTTCVRQDGWAQRGGIDRLLTLADGTVLKVDEKVRVKEWPDFLLERWSDRDRRTPGWAQKSLTCDFIAYAFVATQSCFLLPWQLLRRAWLNDGREWIRLAEHGLTTPRREGFHRGAQGCGVVWADNGSYVTESIAVPTGMVMDALREAMIVRWHTSDQKAA